MEDRDGRLAEAVLAWVGVDGFVRRLLLLAWEIHGRFDEAGEILDHLAESGFLRLREAETMPRGAQVRHLVFVEPVRMVLERLRLAPWLGTRDSRLAEFVVRDCLAATRQLQGSHDILGDEAWGGRVDALYQALARTVADCGLVSLWPELGAACDELPDDAGRAGCRRVVESVRGLGPR